MKPKYSLHSCIWRLEKRLLKLKKKSRMTDFFSYLFIEPNQSEKEADEIEAALLYLKQYESILYKTDSEL